MVDMADRIWTFRLFEVAAVSSHLGIEQLVILWERRVALRLVHAQHCGDWPKDIWRNPGRVSSIKGVEGVCDKGPIFRF